MQQEFERDPEPAPSPERVSHSPQKPLPFKEWWTQQELEARDMASPFLHPIDTVANVGKPLGGTAAKAIPGRQAWEAYPEAVGHYLADRYGGVGNVKRAFTVDPAGVAADVAGALTGGAGLATGGAKLAARIPGAVGSSAE